MSYIVDLFAALHELASASALTLLKLASSERVLLKPYGDTLKRFSFECGKVIGFALSTPHDWLKKARSDFSSNQK